MIEKIEVVSADIDLTLTSKGGQLPSATMQAFELLHSQGVKIGLATGRVIEQREKELGKTWGLSFEFDYVIGMNGGMIYRRDTDSLWSVPMLTSEEMKKILLYMLPLVDKYDLAINVEGGGNHSAINIKRELLESGKRHGFVFEDKTGDIEGFCEKPCYKFLFRGDGTYAQQTRDYFLAEFGDEYQIVETYTGTLEVMKKGIDKGSGLQRYCDDIGVPIAHAIAFGDSENDNLLLKKAGWGVCLKDGHDETKQYADDITDYDCEEGGVGRYLLDHCMNA